MAKRSWTPGQQKAITARGSETLVTASAGTGKTAVLTERYLHCLLDPKAPGVEIRSGAPVVIIVGAQERAAHSAVVRAMSTRAEQSVPLHDLAALVSRLSLEVQAGATSTAGATPTAGATHG